MVRDRVPVVVPSGQQVLNQHPSYGLHALSQQMNAQHAAAQSSQWLSETTSNPYGHFSRPQYRT
jgi:hypothetical protein